MASPLTKYARNWKNILLCGLVLWNVGQLLLCSIQLPGASSQDHPTAPVAEVVSTTGSGPFRVCPHAENLFPNVSNWTSIFYQARDFYERGGSFYANEEFLNRYISITYKKLNMQFVPDEAPNTTALDPVAYLQEYYKTHNITQGGYNQALPGYFTGKNWRYLAFEQHLGGRSPGRRSVNVLEPFKENRFEVAMGPMLLDNECRKVEMSEKIFCDFAVQSESESGKGGSEADSCHIFSLGSNDEWGFEKDMVSRTPSCVTHTFDCTLQPRRMPVSSQIRFYPVCLAGKNLPSNSGYLSYSELVDLAQVPSPPKLLKMDIEGFEYAALLEMLRNTPSSTWPEQISLEVHWGTRMVDLEWMLRTKTTAEMTLWFQSLFQLGGYLPVARQFFPVGCPSCVEMLLVRVLCT